MVLDNVLLKKIEGFKQFVANMIPIAGNHTPSSDTTNGSSGTNMDYARSDHTHPKSNLYAESVHTHSQYLTTHQDISGKLNIAQTSYKGKNVVVDNTTGNITFEDKPTVPQASTSSPLADMTGGAIGSDSKYAKADHQHPKSTLYAEANHTHSDNDVSVTTTNYGSGINQNEFNNYLSYDMINVKKDKADNDTVNTISDNVTDLQTDVTNLQTDVIQTKNKFNGYYTKTEVDEKDNGLINKFNEYYNKTEVDENIINEIEAMKKVAHTSIALDKYNCKVGDTVTVTVTVTGGDGVGLSDYKVDLYCNGTLLSNGITNSSGVYSYSYTVTGKGVLVFNVGEINVQCLAKPVWSTIYSTSNFDLQSDGEHCELQLHIPQRTYGANTGTTIEALNPDYSTYYNPRTLMIPLTSHDVFAQLTYDHKLKILNNNSSSVNIQIYGVFQYTLH